MCSKFGAVRGWDVVNGDWKVGIPHTVHQMRIQPNVWFKLLGSNSSAIKTICQHAGGRYWFSAKCQQIGLSRCDQRCWNDLITAWLPWKSINASEPLFEGMMSYLITKWLSLNACKLNKMRIPAFIKRRGMKFDRSIFASDKYCLEFTLLISLMKKDLFKHLKLYMKLRFLQS